MDRTQARIDRASRLVTASPEAIYRAFTEPEMLIRWLAPKGPRAKLNAFDARPGANLA